MRWECQNLQSDYPSRVVYAIPHVAPRFAMSSTIVQPPPTRRERFQAACRCQATDRPPVWLMRQAGRALPEYRKLKETHSFVELVQHPELAVEVTLQPVRRFGFDAAILFSDILVVPDALGQRVGFESGEGPRLDPIHDEAGISRLRESIDLNHLAPVFETVSRLSKTSPGIRR